MAMQIQEFDPKQNGNNEDSEKSPGHQCLEPEGNKRFSRRDFLRLAGASAIGGISAAIRLPKIAEGQSPDNPVFLPFIEKSPEIGSDPTGSLTISEAVKFTGLGAPKYQFIPDIGNLSSHPEIGREENYFGVDKSILIDPSGVFSDLVTKGTINCSAPPRPDNTWRGSINFIFPERMLPPFFVREMCWIDDALTNDLKKYGNWGSTLTLGRDINNNYDVSVTTLIGGTRKSICIDAHAPSYISDDQRKPPPLSGTPNLGSNQWADVGILVMPDWKAHLFHDGVYSGQVDLYTEYNGTAIDNRLGWIHGGPIYVGTTKGSDYTPGGYALSRGLTVYNW